MRRGDAIEQTKAVARLIIPEVVRLMKPKLGISQA